MRTSGWWMVVGLSATSWAGGYTAETLQAEAKGGCQVAVDVGLVAGYRSQVRVARARREYAFTQAGCFVELGTRQSLSFVEEAPRPPPPTDVREGFDQRPARAFQHAKFVDEVCGDGEWTYELRTTDGPYPGQVVKTAVTVTGCHPAQPCPEALDAPSRVSFTPVPRRCSLLMGMLEVGDASPLTEPLGAQLDGKDVVALAGRAGALTVRALRPGTAHFARAGHDGCAEFTVRPKSYRPVPLDDKKRWAWKDFTRAGATEAMVTLERGVPWPLPGAGEVSFEPHVGSLRMTVDAQCRPALQGTEFQEDGLWAGAELKSPQGARTLFFLNLSRADPAEPCHIYEVRPVTVGEPVRLTEEYAPLVGAGLVVKVKPGEYRAVKPGTVIMQEGPRDTCIKLELSPAPQGATAKEAWARQRLGKRAGLPLETLVMRVGARKSFDALFAFSMVAGPEVKSGAANGRIFIETTTAGLSLMTANVSGTLQEVAVLIDTTGQP